MQLQFLLLCTLAMVPIVDGTSHNMVKRSDDPLPLEEVVMQLSANLQQLQTQVSVLQTKLDTKDQHVAFLAQFSVAGKVTTPASGPLQFDKIIFSEGNAYDRATGIFTAPVSGVYIFAAQFFTHSGQSQRPLLDIKLNGNTYTRLGFHEESNNMSSGEDSDSTAFSIKLQAGDRVWAQSAENKIFYLWGIHHTFFSGALLYSE